MNRKLQKFARSISELVDIVATSGNLAKESVFESEFDDLEFDSERDGEFDAKVAGLVERISRGEEGPFRELEQFLKEHPGDPDLLLITAFAAIREGRPKDAFLYIKRYRKRFVGGRGDKVLEILAFIEQGSKSLAQRILQRDQDLVYLISNVPKTFAFPIGQRFFSRGITDELKALLKWRPEASPSHKKSQRIPLSSATHSRKVKTPTTEPSEEQKIVEEVPQSLHSLPEISCAVRLVEPIPLPPTFTKNVSHDPPYRNSIRNFLNFYELQRLSLLRNFDELLSSSCLQGISPFWYQLETARKAMKQFHGRVLLADEVGLGKTIEAGLILKEYLLRGIVKRFLILVPASLVSQWEEELRVKFSVSCVTSYSPLLKSDPAEFWKQSCVISSISTAKGTGAREHLAMQEYDLVIVDEAHHLKNRKTKAWELVDSLKKRFLLMLSATPVQNSLIELYNLLSLLKPGLFKTERDFRQQYVNPKNERVPLHEDELRRLIREVMIRNTRATTGIALPPRSATTLRLQASTEERNCYQVLSNQVRKMVQVNEGGNALSRLSLRHLLVAAGSSPRAAASRLTALIESTNEEIWTEIRDRYAALSDTAKGKALIEAIQKSQSSKHVIFSGALDTLDYLGDILRMNHIEFARFDGSLTAHEKDTAIANFRDGAPVLISSESGGEGRNLQFCNSLINFDLPWNPLAIEQRIGRIHRIGQTQEVFVLNLSVRETLEDRILEILDEKLNLFQLVVGELQSVLGSLESEDSFESTAFESWIAPLETDREAQFVNLERQLSHALKDHVAARELDEKLFGEELEVV